jgi:hypothetical protein
MVSLFDHVVGTGDEPAARGSDVNPMSDNDLEGKLRTAATTWNPQHDVAPLIDAIWALDRSADASKLGPTRRMQKQAAHAFHRTERSS